MLSDNTILNTQTGALYTLLSEGKCWILCVLCVTSQWPCTVPKSLGLMSSDSASNSSLRMRWNRITANYRTYCPSYLTLWDGHAKYHWNNNVLSFSLTNCRMKNVQRKTKKLAIRPGIENDGKAKSPFFFIPSHFISFFLTVLIWASTDPKKLFRSPSCAM